MKDKRELNGGLAQGSTFGLWEYLSQSNDNADCVNEEERFKFVDDLSFLEVVNLINVGIATYNVKQHVPSNIPTHNQIIKSDNLKSQKYLHIINDWTENEKIKLGRSSFLKIQAYLGLELLRFERYFSLEMLLISENSRSI